MASAALPSAPSQWLHFAKSLIEKVAPFLTTLSGVDRLVNANIPTANALSKKHINYKVLFTLFLSPAQNQPMYVCTAQTVSGVTKKFCLKHRWRRENNLR
jgi:hypothetical protein